MLSRGRLALEWYAEGVTAADRHIVFSVSKSVTALLAGALAGAGRLDLGARVVDAVPELARSGYGDATVRQLLDMTASVDFVEDYSLGQDVMRRYRRAMGWIPGTSEEDLHAFLATLGPQGAHGGRFRYLSPTTDTLGWVCERAAGVPYAEALSTFVWGPMGAESDAEVTVDRSGSARAAGGLSMTARDLARVGQLVLDGGRDVLPDRFVADLFRGGDPALWAAGDFADLFPGAAYRSCWYQPQPGAGVLLALGIHGQQVYVDRRRQVVVVTQSRWPEPTDDAADHAAIAAAGAVASRLAQG